MYNAVKILGLATLITALITVNSLTSNQHVNKVFGLADSAVAQTSTTSDCDNPHNPQRKFLAAQNLLNLGSEAATREEALAKYNEAKKILASLGSKGDTSLADSAISDVDKLPFEINIDLQIAKARRVIFFAKRDGMTKEQEKAESRLSQLQEMKKKALHK